MKFILSLIRKDKQLDNVIDKLFLRISHYAASSAQADLLHVRDVTHCLSTIYQNTMNEKILSKLVECFPTYYADKRSDPGIMAMLEDILLKASGSNSSANKRSATSNATGNSNGSTTTKSMAAKLEILIRTGQQQQSEQTEPTVEQSAEQQTIGSFSEVDNSSKQTAESQVTGMVTRKTRAMTAKKNTAGKRASK